MWLASLATVALLAPMGWLWWSSLLPDSYDMAEMGHADWGGGTSQPHDHQAPPVATLVAADGPAAVSTTLTVRTEGERFTVNGTSPGPLLEAKVGELVEVTLVNEDVPGGATLHWHGVDVPNAADGVAGVTQDAVLPGEEFVYRFVPDQAGTFWYHSHQISHEQVRRGLLGALVVRPREPAPGARAASTAPGTQGDLDRVLVVHDYGDGPAIDGEPGATTIDAAPGRRVRLRVVNTDNVVLPLWVRGAPFRVLAVDGTDLHRPEALTDTRVDLPAGGRVDLRMTVPEDGVRLDAGGTTAAVVGADPTDGDPGQPPDEALDLLSYGSPQPLDFDPEAADRRFDYEIGKRPGFLDGRPGMWWTVNGGIFPDVPMYMVEEGDVVVLRLVNNSDEGHPMHLHGHHAVVLSRDGEPASGSPWVVDSLEVGIGETYEVAFVADNPGIWMDHCHNLPHAREGLMAHVMYTDVHSSYLVGGEHDNQPE